MASIEERLKLKRGQVDTWSTKEKLCLASCVLKCGNQNWMSVSRNLKMFAGEPGRPLDWFSQKSCAVQYDSLLDRVETPKRKKRGADGTKSEGLDISPGESIVKQLVAERIDEIKKLMAEIKHTYLKNKEETYLIESGQADDRLNEFLLQIQEEKKQKEKEQEAHQKWLKEREERKQEMEQAWRPFSSPQHTRGAVGGVTGGSHTPTPGSRSAEARRRPSNQSEFSEPDSNLESPLSVEIGGEETVEVNSAPTPTSPLLTSLLKSPSQAQSSSILHSAITSQRGASPTITSLLNSSPSIPSNSSSASPNIKALVTNALASRAEEGPKSVCHTASGSPTLSMLLELPPSVPGQPLPALPSVATVTSSATISTPVPMATAPVNTVPLEEAPVANPETATVSQPGDVKTDTLPDISAMDLLMPVESEANIAEAERGLNINTADLQHLSHADLELVMDPIDMVLGEGDISLVEEMAVLIEVSSDEVSSSVNSVLDMNSKDALAVAAQAQKLQAEAEAQLQAAAVTSTPVIPRVVLPESSEVVTPTVHMQSSTEQATPTTTLEDSGTPKKLRPVARKIDLEVVPEETPVVPVAPVEEPREEAIEEMTELSEAGEEIETFVEPKPEDVMRTVGLSKEAMENASIVIIQDDGEVLKMSDVVEEKVETEEIEHTDNVELVTTEEVVESVRVAIDNIPVSSDSVEESVVQVEETPVAETSGLDEKAEVDLDREETSAMTKGTPNSKDTEVEDNDEVRKNSVRKSEKEVLPILTLDALKEDHREIILEAGANDESTLDKIHLLVEEETRKNEAKEMIHGYGFECANEDKDGLDDTPLKDLVETYGEEKNDKNADKLRRDELRSSKDSTKGSRSRRNSKREKSPDLGESSNDAVEESLCEKREPSRKRKISSSQESDKSDGKSVSLKKDDMSRKERKISSSQESEKSEGRKSETVSLKREEKERRREEDSKMDDELEKPSVVKIADLAEATDDSSRPGDSDKESSVKYEKTRSETPSTEDDKTSDIELQSTRSSSVRRGRSGRDYSDSVPSSPASTQAITDEEKDYRAWKKSIMLVYGRIAAHKSASLFLRPITDDKAPGYSQMIYRPMDLFTMKKNIENGVIRTTAEFQRDVLLMFNNAIMYNKSGSHVHEMASAMQEEGVQILKEFVNTQLLLQAVGSDAPNVPSRRGTRTTEKRDLDGDKSSTPKAGSSAASASNTPGSTQIQAGKRKRSLVPEEARTVSKRRKADDA